MFENMDIKKFCEKQVVKGNTIFYIHKLPALTGFRVLESLREQLGETMAKVDIGNDQNNNQQAGTEIIKSFILAVAKLPATYVENTLMPALFEHVKYETKDKSIVGLKLLGSEESAFSGLEPIVVYELILRALCVNFYQSFAGMISKSAAAATKD